MNKTNSKQACLDYCSCHGINIEDAGFVDCEHCQPKEEKETTKPLYEVEFSRHLQGLQGMQIISPKTRINIELLCQEYIRQELSAQKREWEEKAFYAVVDVIANGNYINGVEAVEIAEKVREKLNQKGKG